MRFSTAVIFSGLVAAVSAHFQLQYPAPRGPFVEDQEPNFCDGYINAVDNRTMFPLSNGVIELRSEHPSWTIGVIISTAQNPTSQDNFTDPKNSSAFQQVMQYNKQSGSGYFCLPVDIQASGISGVKDGSNVTIEIIFDGGDGQLYQCADLTLSSNASVPSTATSNCTNATNVPIGTSTNSPTSSSTAPASSNSSGASPHIVPMGLSGLLALFGLVLAGL
ncbi:hypothetical protein GLOTRDRAFT_68971 [Gloeophyllum trabeum ATCC 11539]|uniref:Copper acquisition factor BIM1-like domain-containing protein n=1 Tax=Gloeophyllum trabeum (strain ATCC 11539 / FP-39264 / Madison 617) TaxID=670483 RepID=S7S0N4_GLOTA|nr:uncharacterized protein GLOTRDRAFT_68971 [Gloeophyllum trabeum ATCC 11539]EPQ60925.1 hypothetical protein GLOTRDRAFT_68971 [Gloeophyllum trabeum ATCC 11539]